MTPSRLPFLFAVLLLVSSALARPLVLYINKDDLKDVAEEDDSGASEDSSEWDDFRDPDVKSEYELDPGSWRIALEDTQSNPNYTGAFYRRGIRGLVDATASGDAAAMEAAVKELESAASEGFAPAQSAMGFLYGAGIGKAQDRARAFTHRYFAAEGGDNQAKMALAYTYLRQEMNDKAVVIYAELAKSAVASFLISRDPPVFDHVRIHSGMDENRDALRKYRGEDDEDFQVTEYQAMRWNVVSMFRMGMLYYFGLRGIKQDYHKALHWFRKAAEKGDAKSMEMLGEIYASGTGAERNYTEAMLWLTKAANKKLYSAYNGLGYLHIKGYGVERKNLTKAKEYFQMAADHEDTGGHYNLGVLYLKGIGVKRDVKKACVHFLVALNAGQPKAYFQVARMFQKGIGLKKSTEMATILYKLVAERGPWSSLSRWALEYYLDGDIGKALLLYMRMAEMGYEVAQSNAAWILDKYGENSMCMGISGICTDSERHLRAHSLWWQASEQGNEHAALLIGDAYYYGRGTERDFERAAEAYMRAKSHNNAQAMFNLGYMHEHGEGLPCDFHLAKRYYDEALESNPKAKLPVTLALISLWIRKNYAESIMVKMIDSLPEIFPRVEEWVEQVIMDEGNATIFTLFICLLTVLYLRERQRRPLVVNPPQPDGFQPN